MDLLASRFNKLDRLLAKSREPQAFAREALGMLWDKFNLFYFFHPLPCLLFKIKMEGILLIIIATNWPRRLWYLDILELLAGGTCALPHVPPARTSCSKGFILLCGHWF